MFDNSWSDFPGMVSLYPNTAWFNLWLEAKLANPASLFSTNDPKISDMEQAWMRDLTYQRLQSTSSNLIMYLLNLCHLDGCR